MSKTDLSAYEIAVQQFDTGGGVSRPQIWHQRDAAQEFFWNEHEVNEQLEAIMNKAFDAVLQVHLEKQVDMRLAAYIRAIDRVDKATRIRGIYP